MRRKMLAASGILAFVVSSPALAQSFRQKNRGNPDVTGRQGHFTLTLVDEPGRCAIPLVRMRVQSNIDPINVLPRGPKPYRDRALMPSVVPAPSCDERSELLPVSGQHFVILSPRNPANRRPVEYQPAPLPQVLPGH